MSILMGFEAPKFNSPAIMPDGNINFEFNLDDYRDGKKLVIFFYPMDFSPIETTEIYALNKLYPEFKNRDCKLLAISTDNFMSHKKWYQSLEENNFIGKLNFPLVADYTKAISKGYDVITNDTYPYRATFILDEHSVIRYQSLLDFSIGRNINEIIRIIDAIEYTDNNPKLCPANWQKDERAIDVDDEFALKYFSSGLE